MDKREPEPNSLASGQNARSSLPLVINRDGRKPLFNKQSHEKLAGGRGMAGSRGDARPSLSRNGPSDGNNLVAGAGVDQRAGSISPTPSMTSSNGDGSSRIPRPNSVVGPFSKARQQISLADAYRMAKAEEERSGSGPRTTRISPAPIDGSPSPAPRPRPQSQASDDGRIRRMLSKGPLDPGMNRRHSRHMGDHSPADDRPRSIDSMSSSSSFDRRFSQYAEDQQQARRSPAPLSPGAGYSGPSKNRSRTSESGQIVSRKTSNGSLGSGSPRPPAFDKGHVPKGWVAHLLAQEEKRASSPKPDGMGLGEVADVPLPSIEGGGNPPQEPTPPTSRPTSSDAVIPSPNKSYAWQVDQDFTAGDLQISDSPRIQMNTAELANLEARRNSNDAAFQRNQSLTSDDGGDNNEDLPGVSDSEPAWRGRGNDKLDNIRRRELDAVQAFKERADRNQIRSKNTKLDDIRRREFDLEQDGAEPEEDEDPPKNTKIDEIRDREKEFMSKKALASNRLDDIRERNSMSDSLSPEPQPSRKAIPARESTPDAPSQNPGQAVDGGEQVPNTPVTIYRSSSSVDKDIKPDEGVHGTAHQRDSGESKNGSMHARSDSRDLLRRLARATSNSPAPESKREKNEIKETIQKDSDEKQPKQRRHTRKNSRDDRQIIGSDGQEAGSGKTSTRSSGPRRTASTDSSKGKRSSRALSDNDPTDRIEAEMKLFAPTDNQSEKGSVRAPSVGPPSMPPSDNEEEDDPMDETPRPIKMDPLSMPTPKVTGAYVETPVTVKLEDRQNSQAGTEQISGDKQTANTSSPARDKARPRPRSRLFLSETQDEQERDLSSTGPANQNNPSSRLRRRRTRSLPRTRGPLINSAKPPSVKDDLHEIQRTYQIEDSTLDDFEELLNSEKLEQSPPTQINTILNEISTKRKEIASKTESDRDNSEIQRIDRMSKSLKDGLLGIRTAKQGIERLEGNLVHTKHETPTEAKDYIEAQLDSVPDKSEKGHSKEPNRSGENQTSGKTTRRLRKPAGRSNSRPGSPPALHLPLPRLYHRQPFRFTLVGLAILLLSLWYAAETAMCSQFCRPQTCSSANAPCAWSPSDPTWGHAIPVKLDQWISDGQGRRQAGRLADDASDMYLDALDWVTGRDIGDVDIQSLDVFDQRQHRRRLRKKGLLRAPKIESPDVKAKWDAMHQARLEVERREEMREAGFDDDDGGQESFGADEAV